MIGRGLLRNRAMAPAAWLPFALAIACLAVLLAYANHFENSFHFDDFHTVRDNPYIRSLRNLPRFFTDAETFSVLPANRTYRPVVSASLALDYWLGGGLKPLAFQISTFLWYLAQLVLLFFLYQAVLHRADPDPANRWAALFAAAWYGLHPVNADTVNYVIQRAEVLSSVGAIAALLLFQAGGRARRWGLYLIPLVFALLCKQPLLIFPLLLFVYVYLFEMDARRERIAAAVKRVLPALAATGAILALQAAMLPKSYTPGAVSASAYRITQPAVTLRYFQSWFLPLWLSVDTDRRPFTDPWNAEALAGFGFVLVMVSCAAWCARRRELRPIAFGVWWFLVALLPTALFPLAEVENDHRMYFPFAGLALSVSWALELAVRRMRNQRAAAACGVAILAVYGWGTHERNKVWRTEESLWRDVTEKSPRNGRGLMNYGITLMERGDARSALDRFERAAVFTPAYSYLETNLGIAHDELKNYAKAEEHFTRAIQLAPNDAQPHFYYGRWLYSRERTPQALREVRLAAQLNPPDLAARTLLMEILASRREWAELERAAGEALQWDPRNAAALSQQGKARASAGDLETARLSAERQPTPEHYLDLSLLYHRSGRYPQCIDAARQALKLNPRYAEAYNNIAAAYQSMGMWDEAIVAAQEALRLNPKFELARNNLTWAQAQRQAQRLKAAGR